MSSKGFSLIQWDFDANGLPRRSLQVETEIAKLWANSYELLINAKAFVKRAENNRNIELELINLVKELIKDIE